MSIPLQPKRFESLEDHKWDTIRYKSWFRDLEKRRAWIPMLRMAAQMVKNGHTQIAAAEEYSIDARELRDFIAFHYHPWPKADRTFQQILDESYEIYCKNNGDIRLSSCIDRIAPFYGKKTRHVLEEYEVNPTFYPTGYVYQTNAASACLTKNELHQGNASSGPPPMGHR